MLHKIKNVRRVEFDSSDSLDHLMHAIAYVIVHRQMRAKQVARRQLPRPTLA